MPAHDYELGKVSLESEVTEPSYEQCLDWLRGSPLDASATFDYWARGNFTRHVLYNRQKGHQPLLVAVDSVPQARSAYRRLALLGLPVDLVYCGNLSEPHKLLHMVPVSNDTMIDSGWGYVGTFAELADERWLQLVGTARLMPQAVYDWLINEVPSQFERGQVFVAPAELIGLPRVAPGAPLDSLAEVSRACSVAQASKYGGASTVFKLELPYLEGMSATDFSAFLQDHEEALSDFRNAVRDLVAPEDESDIDVEEAVKLIRHEVSEMTQSARWEALRTFITKCGGQLKTVQGMIGALGAAGAVASQDPFAGAAVATGATKVLRDLWREARTEDPNMSSHRLRLLWELGAADREEDHRENEEWQFERARLMPADRIDAHHWLCPPTAGIELAFVRKET